MWVTSYVRSATSHPGFSAVSTRYVPLDARSPVARRLLGEHVRTGPRRPITVLAGLALAAGALPPVTAGPGRGDHGTRPRPIYLDTSYTPAERAADLVSRMTLAEKARR